MQIFKSIVIILIGALNKLRNRWNRFRNWKKLLTRLSCNLSPDCPVQITLHLKNCSIGRPGVKSIKRASFARKFPKEPEKVSRLANWNAEKVSYFWPQAEEKKKITLQHEQKLFGMPFLNVVGDPLSAIEKSALQISRAQSIKLYILPNLSWNKEQNIVSK